VLRVKMRHRAKCRGDRCLNDWLISFLKDGGRCHLGFVIFVWITREEYARWSLSLCKIWLESVQ